LKVSLLSSPTADKINVKTKRFLRIISALERSGIDGNFHFFNTRQQLIHILQVEQPDLVFCVDYYTRGDANEPVNIHQILEDLNVPYIGSSPDALELVLSKSELKKKWLHNHVSTPSYFVVREADSQYRKAGILDKAINYPYILKPDREGNSRGLDANSIVFNRTALESKLKELLVTYEEVLIEKYLGTYPDIREYTVAMIGNSGNWLLMPARVILKKKKKFRMITTRDKDDHLTRAIPVIDDELKKRLIAESERAFKVSGVRDYSRCDMIFADGELYAIEVNGQPMIPDKWFDECARGLKLDTDQCISAIFLSGLMRNMREGKVNIQVPEGLRDSLPPRIYTQLTAA